MSDKLKESLSAVIDGEADEFELRRFLDEADRDPELRASWERYHLIGAMIKGEPVSLTSRLQQRVRDALSSEIEAVEGEPLIELASDKPAPSPWLGRLTGIAVAASVAFVVAVNFNFDDDSSGQIELSDKEPVVTIPVNELRLAEFITAADRQRTSAYMVHHVQHTGLNNQGGVVPFVKVAAYESQ